MKNKKIIASVLAASLLLSSFSGVFLSYAKSGATPKDTSNNTNEIASEFEKAPTPSVTELKPEENDKKIVTKAELEPVKPSSKIIYKSTEIGDSTQEDIYNIDGDDVDELLEQGFTIKDLFKADEIANSILEDPKNLLNMKKETGKTLDEVKDMILEERKQVVIEDIKKEHGKEFNKLVEKGLTEDEIISMISYLDRNDLKLTDSLIEEYKNSGDKILKEKKDTLSKEYKKKYNLSAKDLVGLTDETLDALEKISEMTGKPMKELLKNFDRGTN
ncbi:MAG: hypothetical protein ACERKN_03950 [Velocimicrobium sp.]